MTRQFPYYVERGNVEFVGASSEAEVDWLHTQVLPEEIHLREMLERNNADLIRLGVAEKVETAHITNSLGSMATNWAVSGMDPSPEKIELHMGKVLATVGPYTQFRVGENVLAKLEGKESPDVSVLHIGMAKVGDTDSLPKGEQSIWWEVGTRLMQDGEAVSFIPNAIGSSSISLSGDQLYEIGTMVDGFMQEAAYGELPHLSQNGRFDSLTVPGLSVEHS